MIVVYMKNKGMHDSIYLLLYVDNMLIGSKSCKDIQQFKFQFQKGLK